MSIGQTISLLSFRLLSCVQFLQDINQVRGGSDMKMELKKVLCLVCLVFSTNLVANEVEKPSEPVQTAESIPANKRKKILKYSQIEDFHTYSSTSSLTLGHLNAGFTSQASVDNPVYQRDLGGIVTLFFQNSLSLGLGDSLNIGTKIGWYLLNFYDEHYNASIQWTAYKNEKFAVSLFYHYSYSTFEELKIITREPAIGFMAAVTDNSLLSFNIITNNKSYGFREVQNKLSYSLEYMYRFNHKLQMNVGYERYFSEQLLDLHLQSYFEHRDYTSEFTIQPLINKSYENLASAAISLNHAYWFVETTQLGIKYSKEFKRTMYSVNFLF